LLGPETAHSPNAEQITTLYWVLLVVAVIVVVAVNLALLGLIGRFRAERGREPSRRFRGGRRTQLIVASALGAVALALFVAGVAVTRNASQVQASGSEGLQASSARLAQRGLNLPEGERDPLTISASGQQWIWRYEYPDGTFSYYELVVPVDTAVVLEIDSTDVVHRWWVPSLAGKFDAVPGRINRTWFRADEEGVFDGRSAAFSGAGYAAMRTRVRVVSPAEYEAWLTQQAADIQAAQDEVQAEVVARGVTGPAPGGGAAATGGSDQAGEQAETEEGGS
jgi:cytochrome c oxidase subunit II